MISITEEEYNTGSLRWVVEEKEERVALGQTVDGELVCVAAWGTALCASVLSVARVMWKAE